MEQFINHPNITANTLKSRRDTKIIPAQNRISLNIILYGLLPHTTTQALRTLFLMLQEVSIAFQQE
jgi:hypothetical protein